MKAGGAEEKPGARGGGGGSEGEDTEWADRGQEVWRRGWGERAVPAEVGVDCTAEAHMSEESEEGVTVIRQGEAPRVTAAKSSELGQGKL